MTAPRFRIAPSPTGFFHVGGARTALFNWALAKRLGGTFLLRIEDTDAERNRPEWDAGIVEALSWIGIHADDPTFEGPYHQSDFAAQHVAAAERLLAAGVAYYCDMSGDEIQARAAAEGTQGYGGWSRDRGLTAAPGRALRFRVPAGQTVVHDAVRGEVVFDNATIEDFVLLRGNGSPMFLLANVVDDIEMRITHVVRGEEHLPNTPKQQMLWEALGVPAPVWGHVPVLVNEQRKKLSKRRDRVALESYRDDGILPEAMVNYLMTLGWSPRGGDEIVPWTAMEQEFALDDVNHSPALFDVKKLGAFNKEYIKAMPVDVFVTAARPWLDKWLVAHPGARWNDAMFLAMAPHVQVRIETLSQAAGVVDFMFLAEPEFDEPARDKAMAAEWAPTLLADTIDAFSALAESQWVADELKAAFEQVAERHELKAGKAQAPVRVAITGRTSGPPLFEPIEMIGRDESLRRLRALREGAVVA